MFSSEAKRSKTSSRGPRKNSMFSARQYDAIESSERSSDVNTTTCFAKRARLVCQQPSSAPLCLQGQKALPGNLEEDILA